MPLPGADAASDAEVSFADLSETRSGLESQMEAVVKVFCVHSEPNFSLPWQRKRQFSSSGSGFVISGRRILTNAHCVDHHTQVRVKRRGSDAKLVARVLAVGPECDVALLTVDDDAFWEGLEPVRLGPLPRLQDAVAVVGYPIGGDTMSVTSGVVSRIEVTSYVHGAAELLGVQVDAAINSGNSGGPAFGPGGECVGIAFQSLKHEDAENISYIIPTPVVEHFIRDYETHGAYTGFPSLGIEWQKMESPVMRRALGMAPDERGVLVRRVEPTSPLAPLLGQGDVLLSFDGVAIGSDGTVPFRFGERIGFNYLVSQKYTGDSAQLGVRRARRDGDSAKQSVGVSCVRQLPVPKVPKVSARGTSKTAASQPHASEVCLFELQLQAFSRLIPVHIDNRPPSYFIYGGLVFTPATVPLLRSEYGKEFDFDAPVKLLDKMMHAMAQSPGQQVIILSQVLAAEANVGYEDVVNTQVLAVDGQAVHSLRELVALVEGGPPREIIRFDLEYQQAIALDRAQVAAATADILRQHCIPADRSVDLLGGS
ncbi:hypothetical protein H632_c960p1 [Helicosporidium sp. ATCC 50920]|nr:hypothetical protein H632_c960p1 [Helicosporidium sp. ATCC 50920]|eukprot:KDD74963.1 hypothetical protein H632_c960p1 [Helicosporidium sp. ATCC 50920]